MPTISLSGTPRSWMSWWTSCAGSAAALSGGLPVCTIEKIVADLLADHEDESAVAQIARDGIRDGLLARDELERAAARYGTDYGYRSATDFAAVLAGR
jgi:hypothetical protein